MKPRSEDTAASRDAASKDSPSRRRFLKTIAAGTVAAVAGRSVIAAATPRRRASGRPKVAAPIVEEPQRSAPVEAEIKSQKGYTARTLKTIRDYPLPPGSEMAFAFKPMKAARAGRSGRSGR